VSGQFKNGGKQKDFVSRAAVQGAKHKLLIDVKIKIST
jgi:hypothetical protein